MVDEVRQIEGKVIEISKTARTILSESSTTGEYTTVLVFVLLYYVWI